MMSQTVDGRTLRSKIALGTKPGGISQGELEEMGSSNHTAVENWLTEGDKKKKKRI